MPRKDAILQGEIALGALEGRFWLPGSSVCIGGRALAQGGHPKCRPSESQRGHSQACHTHHGLWGPRLRPLPCEGLRPSARRHGPSAAAQPATASDELRVRRESYYIRC